MTNKRQIQKTQRGTRNRDWEYCDFAKKDREVAISKKGWRVDVSA